MRGIQPAHLERCPRRASRRRRAAGACPMSSSNCSTICRRTAPGSNSSPAPAVKTHEDRDEREKGEEGQSGALGERVALDPGRKGLAEDRSPEARTARATLLRRVESQATVRGTCNARSRRPRTLGTGPPVGLNSRPMPPLPTETLPGRAVFGLLVLVAIVAFVYSLLPAHPGAARGAPDNRFTRIAERIGRTLEYAFAQKRMFRDFYAGVFHILIFGGFVVLTVRTIELVVEGLVPGFVLLPGTAGNPLHARQGRLRGPGARRRRDGGLPPRSSRARSGSTCRMDAWLILFLIAFLMVTDLVAEGARAALAPALDHAVGAGRGRRGRGLLAGASPGAAAGDLRARAGGCTSSTSSSSATTCRTRSTSTSSRRSRTSSS